MNGLTAEVGYVSLIKKGEELCGDQVETVRFEDSTTLVLADGLGSGVKANILSTLTSKIIATMMANGMPVEECVRTITRTLPICKVRKVAYSTFTVMQVNQQNEMTLLQFDNPSVILLRGGVSIHYPQEELVIDGKKVIKSVVKVKPNDIFLTMSDGALYAGVGKMYNYGWQRDNIIDYLEARYEPDLSAKMACTIIAEECDRLYDHAPGDDTTVAAIRIRPRQTVSLMIGPPEHPEDDQKAVEELLAGGGKTIVCGGTTSNLVSRVVGKPLIPSIEYFDPEIPPTAKIQGIDLVTEGVITIGQVLKLAKGYLENEDLSAAWAGKKDGASRIAQLLFEEATDIRFVVGRAINPAHQNPDLPISIVIKMGLIDELAEILRKMGKQVTVSYY